MIPSVIATQVRRGIEDFLETTFPVSTPLFEGIIGHLLKDDHAVFQGPYYSVSTSAADGSVLEKRNRGGRNEESHT